MRRFFFAKVLAIELAMKTPHEIKLELWPKQGHRFQGNLQQEFGGIGLSAL